MDVFRGMNETIFMKMMKRGKGNGNWRHCSNLLSLSLVSPLILGGKFLRSWKQ